MCPHVEELLCRSKMAPAHSLIWGQVGFVLCLNLQPAQLQKGKCWVQIIAVWQLRGWFLASMQQPCQWVYQNCSILAPWVLRWPAVTVYSGHLAVMLRVGDNLQWHLASRDLQSLFVAPSIDTNPQKMGCAEHHQLHTRGFLGTCVHWCTFSWTTWCCTCYLKQHSTKCDGGSYSSGNLWWRLSFCTKCEDWLLGCLR